MPQLATKRAVFDAGSKDRRLMIAKIHVAKKQMALGDDDYRAMLIRVTGCGSSKDCSLSELRAMVEAMKAQGFKAAKPSTLRMADHPSAKKARALWISLYHLGAIDNPSEQALEAFAKRQMKVERLSWANQSESYKLIEALKAIAQRNGWDQRSPAWGGIRGPSADGSLRILKVRLVERITQLLTERGLAPVEWTLRDFAWRLAGIEREGPVPMWDFGDLDLLAQELGGKLREAGRG